MIEVRSITKSYGEKKAVNNLSFKIEEGEIVGLLGLNGAGKSTILKTLGTLLPASDGDAFISGYSVSNQAEDVRKQIGYLPDTPPLYDEMTIRGYLEFVAKLKGVTKSQLKSQVDEALDHTNLTDVQTQRLSELSHGYRQRTNIAQALVHRPKVLILDEPINGLDPVQIVEMRDLILSLKKKHTVILSSHILSEITRTCDRILVIDKGRLVAEGSEHELRAQAEDKFAIHIEIAERADELVHNLRALDSVLSAQLNARGHIEISAAKEIRPQLAKYIIQQGFDLLTIERREAELETLFLKLVAGDKEGEKS